MTTPRILVVEDEPDNAWIFRVVCEMAGCKVVIAPDLASARRVLSQSDPVHLIVLDLLLPDGHGLELCEEVKASRPSIPVLVVTASGDPRDNAVAFNACADRFMKKPIDPDRMERVVLELLALGKGR